MKWNKFRLKTTTEAEDIVSSMLADLGIEGVEIEDKIPLTESDKEQMFVDILPETGINDGIAYVSFYLEEDEDKESLLEAVKNELEDMRAYVEVGEGTIEESQTEDVDWVNNWKKYFHQFYVDDILIIPSWEEVKPEDEGKMIVHIDPGTAFGTGMHETTQLCIRQLKKYVTDDAKNFMHYSNTEYDDVFNTAYTTVDDDVKVENYKKAQMILAEDAAAVYIEDPANLVAVSKKFGGYTFYPTAAEDMSLLYQVEQ